MTEEVREKLFVECAFMFPEFVDMSPDEYERFIDKYILPLKTEDGKMPIEVLAEEIAINIIAEGSRCAFITPDDDEVRREAARILARFCSCENARELMPNYYDLACKTK